MTRKLPARFGLSLLPLSLFCTPVFAEDAADQLDTVYVTAERQLQQSLGVSKITAEDLEKRPPVNDISDLVRTMPGVNLTGNTANGQHGNKRQIDIRGMGPENTLILIDGRPVTSRNSTRMSWGGERDTTGDSNWVPVEDIESIEVIRGPAAARYGSGAAGGVVNIVTKKVSNDFRGSLTYYTNQPSDKDEGATNRLGFNFSGPLVKDVLSYRIYGNYNHTDADSLTINNVIDSEAAGNEGKVNKDLGARLAWKITPEQTLTLDTAYSRQGNIYNGDAQNSNPSKYTKSLDGQETRRLYRQSYALTHDGVWDWGDSRFVLQYDRTTNSRCPVGLAGGPEGQCIDPGAGNGFRYINSLLKTYRAAGDIHIPFTWGVGHVLTLGAEYNYDSLDDPDSMKQTLSAIGYSADRKAKSSMAGWAVYAEDNISVSDKFKVIPTLRFDHNNTSGSNVSPGLNMSYLLAPSLTLKGGIARAYKAPNLYQSNENYLLYTRGNGCPILSSAVRSCYLKGNADLKPETSWNKEIGLEYNRNGYLASLAYFRNDYKNKITSGDTVLSSYNNPKANPGDDGRRVDNILQWENARKAVVEGLEGNVTLPLTQDLKWSTNFTYMLQSKNKDTGNPLSIIPKYTVNSNLAWQISEKFDTMLTFTYYGRQKPRQFANNNIENTERGKLSHEELGSYGIWGLSAGYRFNKNVEMRMGMTNIFDKKIYRSTTEGSAMTYNERGRAIFGSMKVSF